MNAKHFAAIYTMVVALMVLLVTLGILLLATNARAGAEFGTEGGGNQECKTTNLPANIWSLVSYDNAGQPCWTKPDADDPSCSQANAWSATWDWQMHGSIRFEARRAGKIEVRTYVGNGGGSCYGGTNDPPFCDNPATHYLQEDGTFPLQGGNAMMTAVPFEFLIYQAPPWFQTEGDANYFGMWVFAKPSVAAVCESTNYGDLVYKDEAQ